MEKIPTKSRLEEIQSALKQKGYRLTRSRRIIVQVLLDCGGHISADNLLEVIHRADPGVGRMTVYRTLDLLTELGLIRPVYQGTGAAHFILFDGGHHHHLVCSGCDRVIEFEECSLQEMANLLAARFNFDVQGHLLEFYGRCPSCQ